MKRSKIEFFQFRTCQNLNFSNFEEKKNVKNSNTNAKFHFSGSQDCQSPSKRFLVIPAKLSSNNNNAEIIGAGEEVARENDNKFPRGILKRARCLSESQAEYLSLVTSSVIDSGSSTSSTIIEEENIGKCKKKAINLQ